MSNLLNRLKNTKVCDLVSALERDGFTLRRSTLTGGRIYAHPDGRLTVVHFHKGSETLPIGTLKSIVQAVQWNEADAKRLGLM